MAMKPIRIPKDFTIDNNYYVIFRKREILIRFLLIIFIALISPTLDYGIPVTSAPFLKAALISFLRTALLWHGSMMIIIYCTSTFSIFRQAVKLMVIQLLLLSAFVVLVEMGEIYAMRVFAHQPLNMDEGKMLIFTSLLITFLISSIYASVSFFMQWKENLLKAQNLEKANLEAQYETLKAQVNPHFLFNSLNTLLSIVEGQAAAEKYIENLSEFMRYILKNRDKQGVTLNEELEVARQYVYLQKSRFSQKLKVDIEIPEKYNSFTVPPLTLQMLIENAIKHNEISNENALHIRVFMKDESHIAVENGLRKKTDAEPSTGIGLKNIQNRYQFLFGKDIEITESNTLFTVVLPLTEQSK
jgi:two-component system, LytTR family, sensor kinase